MGVAVAFSALLMMQDFSASCMIEVARLTGQEHLLTSEQWRVGAQNKAAALKQNLTQLSLAYQDVLNNAVRREAVQRDLFENGLITPEEWRIEQEKLAQVRAETREFVEATRTDLPSCNLTENVRYLPIFRDN